MEPIMQLCMVAKVWGKGYRIRMALPFLKRAESYGGLNKKGQKERTFLHFAWPNSSLIS